jgi:hypothetical protein
VTDAGVAIIFLAFGVGALLAAAIPGLSFGLAIGMFVNVNWAISVTHAEGQHPYNTCLTCVGG